MLNAIIIVLILVGLTTHRYLSTFWEQNKLPYPMGFNIFANLFALIFLVGYIWIFGVVPGIIVSILSYFQIVYSAFLWVFLLPYLISTMRNNFSDTVIAFMCPPKVNPLIYGGFSILVIILGILVASNFFISGYKSAWNLISDNYWTVALVSLGVLVLGNIVRLICLRLIAGKS
jgi:hypothetical protein